MATQRVVILWVIGCLVGVAASTAQVSPSPPLTDRANPGPDEVILFEGRNFSGAAMLFGNGAEVPDLDKLAVGRWNDRISSLKVGSDVIVVTWFLKGYQGWCEVFFGANAGGKSGRYADLGKFRWDNRIDSLKVYPKDAQDIPCL